MTGSESSASRRPEEAEPASSDRRTDRATGAAGAAPALILRDTEIRYRELFESTGDAIMLLDERGFLECNQATLQMFGYRTKQDFLAKHPSEVSPPQQPDGVDSRPAADAHIAQAFREGMARF
jgi:PAS domain-containing protein